MPESKPDAKPETKIEIRQLHSMDEFRLLLALEQRVWSLTPDEAVSPYTMNAVSHNGGLVLGAFAGEEMLGFAFGFPARRPLERGGHEWLLWSHITGVAPEMQGQNLGFRLKQAQREWAIAQGYERIGWTFDPMRRGNANFNLHHLGAWACQYFPDHYGVMLDGLNAGLASDRLEAIWHLKDARVQALARGSESDGADLDISALPFLLRQDERGHLHMDESVMVAARIAIEIPADLDTLKDSDLARARAWQMRLREAMQRAFAAGYIAVDFLGHGGQSCYLLRRR